MNTRASRFATLFAVLFLGWLEFNSVVWFVADWQASHWPSVDGRVNAKQDCLPVYACGVSYSYRVGEKEYQGHRISFTPAHLPKGWNVEETRQWVDREFQVGRVIPVHYDPAKPENAALQVGVLKADYLIGTGIIALVLAALIAWSCRSYLQTKKMQALRNYEDA